MASPIPEELKNIMYESAPSSIIEELKGREDEAYDKILEWIDNNEELQDDREEMEVMAAIVAPWLLSNADTRYATDREHKNQLREDVKESVKGLRAIVNNSFLLAYLGFDQAKVRGMRVTLGHFEHLVKLQKDFKKPEKQKGLFMGLALLFLKLKDRKVPVKAQHYIVLDLFKIFDFEDYARKDWEKAVDLISKMRLKILGPGQRKTKPTEVSSIIPPITPEAKKKAEENGAIFTPYNTDDI